MSVASSLLQAALGLAIVLLIRRFDLRDRFEVVSAPGSLKFDPGAAIFAGAVALVAFGLVSGIRSAVG